MSKLKCPECGSKRVWKTGTVPTKCRGRMQRYQCQGCATSFGKPVEPSGVVNAEGDK